MLPLPSYASGTEPITIDPGHLPNTHKKEARPSFRSGGNTRTLAHTHTPTHTHTHTHTHTRLFGIPGPAEEPRLKKPLPTHGSHVHTPICSRFLTPLCFSPNQIHSASLTHTHKTHTAEKHTIVVPKLSPTSPFFTLRIKKSSHNSRRNCSPRVARPVMYRALIVVHLWYTMPDIDARRNYSAPRASATGTD